MSHHVPEELLGAFVLGDIDDELAVHIAEHLDACPACATRAAGLEPLALAFAAVDDPVAPDLVDAVLAEVGSARPAEAGAAPHRVAPEVPVGASLLAAAVLLTAAFGGPLAGLEGVRVLPQLVISVARALGAGLGATPGLVAATFTAAVLGLVFVALLADPLQLTGGRPLLLGSRDDRTGEPR